MTKVAVHNRGRLTFVLVRVSYARAMEITVREIRCLECRPLKHPVRVEVEVGDGQVVQVVMVHFDNRCHLIHIKLLDN